MELYLPYTHLIQLLECSKWEFQSGGRIIPIENIISMSQSKPKKTRYSDHELSDFSTLISRKLTQAKSQLEFYLEQIHDSTNNSNNRVNGVEEGIQSAENERLVDLAGRQKKLIHHLENANLRIQNKLYGICRETGELISKARLEAVPHATLSIKAKQRQVKK